MLFRLLDDRRDVEEATQDCFVQAWRNLHRFRAEASVFTWLYRIAVNEALARLRRKRLPVVGFEDSARQRSVAGGRTAEPQEVAEIRERQAFVAERLRRLSIEYRAPLVLRDVLGLSNREVADVLEISVAAAKSRIHRARMQIREELEQWERASEISGSRVHPD